MGGKNSAGLQSNTRHTAAKRAPVAPTTGSVGGGLGSSAPGDGLQTIPSMEDLQGFGAPANSASVANQALKVPTSLNPIAPLQTGVQPSPDKGTIFRQRRDLDSILINNVETRVDEVAMAMGKTLGIPEDQLVEALKNLDIVFSKNDQEDERYRFRDGSIAHFTHIPELYDPSLTPQQIAKIIKDRETNLAEALKHGQITFSYKFLQGLKKGHINDLPQVALHELGHFLMNQKSGGNHSKRNLAAEEATVELVSQSMAPTPRVTYQGAMLSLLFGLRDQHPEMSDEEIVGHILQAGLLQDEKSLSYIDAVNPKKHSTAESSTAYPTVKFGPEYLAKIREMLRLPYDEQKGAFKAIKEKDRDYYYHGPELHVSQADIGNIVKAATKKIKEMGFNVAPEQELDNAHTIREAKNLYTKISNDSRLPQKYVSPQQIKNLLPLWESLAPTASLGTPSTDEEKQKQDKAFDNLIKQAAAMRRTDAAASGFKASVQYYLKNSGSGARHPVVLVPVLAQIYDHVFNSSIGLDQEVFTKFLEKHPDALSTNPTKLVGADRAQMKRELGTIIFSMQLARQKVLRYIEKDLNLGDPYLSFLTQAFYKPFLHPTGGLYATLTKHGFLSQQEMTEMNIALAQALHKATL